MMFLTHMAMAKEVYKRIKSKDPSISQGAFILGNILPDVNYMVWKKHNLDQSKEDLQAALKACKSQDLSPGQRTKNLGIACHFISDYFCKYHSKKPYNQMGLWKHFLYEWKLHLLFYRVKWLKRASFANAFPKIDLNGESLQSIEKWVANYLQDHKSSEMDLMYAMSAMNALVEAATEPSSCIGGFYEDCNFYRHLYSPGKWGYKHLETFR